MKKVLVLGGTRYFGKRLVSKLVENGIDVTVASRGLTADPFGSKIKREVLNRENETSLTALAKKQTWDIVFDQICYTSSDATAACKAFKNQVGRYVFTSTGSVYVKDGIRDESDFDPYNHKIRYGDQSMFDYGEGKRQAEAVFFQEAKFPVAAMRIPIVLGIDDYTGRLEFHIKQVSSEQPLVIENLEAETCFIDSQETVDFLFWLGQDKHIGPINGCSDGRYSIGEIVKLIENSVNKKANILKQGAEEHKTSFVESTSRLLNNNRASSKGFQFKKLNDWFPELVEKLSSK